MAIADSPEIFDVLTLHSVFGAAFDSTGSISRRDAYRLAWLWQGVSQIAADIASLPLELVRSTEGERMLLRNDPRWRLLNIQASPTITARTMRETMMQHAILHGNAVAVIERLGTRPLALHLIPPECVTVMADAASERYVYSIMLVNGQTLQVPQQDVVHIRGLSWDGVIGEGVLHHAGVSLRAARQELEARRIYFDRQSLPGVALLPQRPLTQEQVALLRETFAARYGQSDKAASALVLPHGIDLKPIAREQLVGHDKDVWEQARLEIAAWLNIPPYKLGAAAPATSLEQQQRQYLSHTLRPWLVRWEDELRAKLLTPQEQVLLYWEHDTDVLISADIEARYRAYEIGIRSRFLSPNEVRREENLPPYEGGDKFENPNTSSGASNDANANSNNNDTTTRNLARAYLCDVFSRLATLEKSRLETAAKEASVQALLAVYDKLPWSSYVGDALKAVSHTLGVECHLEQLRSRYAAMRGDEIAKLAADAERRGQTLRAAVQQYDWHERAVEFARSIIEGERDGGSVDDDVAATAR